MWSVYSFAYFAFTTQKMKFSIKNFFCKCDQIQIGQNWSHLLEKSLMENFNFCAVTVINSLMHNIEKFPNKLSKSFKNFQQRFNKKNSMKFD